MGWLTEILTGDSHAWMADTVLQEAPLDAAHVGSPEEGAGPLCLTMLSFPGEEFYEASPYEPVTSRLSDIFRLASIFSGKRACAGPPGSHLVRVRQLEAWAGSGSRPVAPASP
ncbi:hypothetical protein QTO34_015220 [Cnephaeus nilssonii]|uniref:Uncharacterized protein n=1 Tax=Cnephaeus nilssonii TaxID=3371016 RepID=A0AA40I4P2_CNENI|nr:hypothetical protein QTO34_015220 [Eptesicus nilssonii]